MPQGNIKNKKIDKKAAANRHGKTPQTRKGKFDKPPQKARLQDLYKENKEITKMINANNESNAAAKAENAGGRLKALKAPPPILAPKGKKKAAAAATAAGSKAEAMQEDDD